jgi:hypothetical protein
MSIRGPTRAYRHLAAEGEVESKSIGSVETTLRKKELYIIVHEYKGTSSRLSSSGGWHVQWYGTREAQETLEFKELEFKRSQAIVIWRLSDSAETDTPYSDTSYMEADTPYSAATRAAVRLSLNRHAMFWHTVHGSWDAVFGGDSGGCQTQLKPTRLFRHTVHGSWDAVSGGEQVNVESPVGAETLSPGALKRIEVPFRSLPLPPPLHT